MRRPTLSIVVPAYNEEARIGRTLEALRDTAPAEAEAAGLELCEAIVVDDGSTDATPSLLREPAPAGPRLRTLVMEHNAGKGAATAAGVGAAVGDMVLTADADIATPFSELAKLQDRIRDGADIAIASRDLPGAEVYGASRSRILMGRAFNRLVRALTGLPFRDTQCGFKLMATRTARELYAEQTVPGFAFDVEILTRARSRGLRVAEVPVRYHHGPDSSVRPLRAGPRMAFDVVRVAARLRGPRSRSGPPRDDAD